MAGGSTQTIRIVYNRLPALRGELGFKVDRIVAAHAEAILGSAKYAIQDGNKTGRVYQRGKRYHRASAPGEAPATDMDNLNESGKTASQGLAKREVSFNAEYAAALEFGHFARRNKQAKSGATVKEPVWVAARPFLRPAVSRQRDAFVSDLTKLLRGLG